eukprot:gene29577-36856_t
MDIHLRPFIKFPVDHLNSDTLVEVAAYGVLDSMKILKRVQPATCCRMAVALVRTPAESAAILRQDGAQEDFGARLEAALRAYFTNDRLLAPGDLFAVLTPEPRMDPYGPWQPTAEEARIVHLKVLSMELDGGATVATSALVNRASCRLTLNGSTSCSLPPSSASFVLSSRLDPHLEGGECLPVKLPAGIPKVPGEVPPAVLCESASEVAGILSPALHAVGAQLRGRPAVLLAGPEGVGKRSCVEMAAAALGCHLVPLSCFELWDETETKIAAAVAEAFASARRYAPAVLLLRDFEAIATAASSSGQAPSAGVHLPE